MPTPPTHKVPFGEVQSFGAMIFVGMGAPAGARVRSTAITARPSYDRPRHVHPSNPYGISAYGYSPGPFKGFTVQWVVTLVADGGGSEAAACQAVEDGWNLWYTAWTGTHTHKGIAGVTGQVGLLRALDQAANLYEAEAELTELPTDNQLGRISVMQLTLVWTLNDDWTLVTP